MKTLHEQYRPQAWSDVVGQDKAITRFRIVAKRGIGGRCFWITGKSGTGKTTIAQTEGLDGRPIEQYVRLVNKHGANLRAVLQSVEAGEMTE